MSPGDELDNDIGHMLAGLQIGNIDEMHKYYADNATFVSSTYAPPIVGFANWAAGYQRQRAGFSGMQIVRRNTVIFPHGDVAWATYQWEFTGMETTGQPYAARGQTTLVFNQGRKQLAHRTQSYFSGLQLDFRRCPVRSSYTNTVRFARCRRSTTASAKTVASRYGSSALRSSEILRRALRRPRSIAGLPTRSSEA